MINKLFFVFVLLLSVLNFFAWPIAYDNTLRWPEHMRVNVPGQRIMPFKKHLQGVQVVGYHTDRYRPGSWYQPEFATYLQRYQYTLSPVQMDWEGRFSHDNIIFDCRQGGCEKKDVDRLGLILVAAIGEDLMLMRKK
jgi:hypothetical protein